LTAVEFVRLDPKQIKIGANVRTDLHPDAKEFARSIKERGVLEPVSVYLDDDGSYVVWRGQRRTVVAAEVGTPTGVIPAQVVPKPGDAERIGDHGGEPAPGGDEPGGGSGWGRAARADRSQRRADRPAHRPAPADGERRPGGRGQGGDPCPGPGR
jgi:hypothetical protein